MILDLVDAKEARARDVTLEELLLGIAPRLWHMPGAVKNGDTQVVGPSTSIVCEQKLGRDEGRDATGGASGVGV